MYFSIHQYTHGVSAEEKQFHFIGEEQGRGFNININMDEVFDGKKSKLAFHHKILGIFWRERIHGLFFQHYTSNCL